MCITAGTAGDFNQGGRKDSWLKAKGKAHFYAAMALTSGDSFETTDYTVQLAQSETVRVSGLLQGAEVQGLEVCTDPGVHVQASVQKGERKPAASCSVEGPAHEQR